MSRYKAYPEYKDSGVEWLGDIPVNWVATPLKRVISRLESGVSVNATDVPAQEGEIGVLKTSCVYTRSFRSSENKAVFPEELHRVKCPVRNGTLIISRMNTPDLVGASALVECETDNLYLPDRLWQTESLSLVPKFVAYFMMVDGFRAQILLAAEGASSSMQNIAKENYLAIHAAHPLSRLEQEKIAAFLDHETAKIDALIEKQQRLIELLKEKRQAVTSHAVTKGLNPSAPMKDSGVEWLGEVPAHWVVTQPRHVCSFAGGGTPSKDKPEFWEGDIPWVSPKDMKVDFIHSAQDCISHAAVENSAVKLIGPGALLIVVRGMILDHSVPVAIAKVSLTINQDMKALIPQGQLNGEYLLFCLKGLRDSILDLVESSAHGTKCLRTEQFDRMPLPLPPFSEQLAIANKLNNELRIVDDLILKAEAMIELARERRTALISAAVTGKIDVRDWQPVAA